jgi:hypothetical protein
MNLTRGKIKAFDATSGVFLGPLPDAGRQPIIIDNDWAIQFGTMVVLVPHIANCSSQRIRTTTAMVRLA